MTCAAIELGDAGILVVGDDGVVRAPGSPGYALLDGNRLLIGLEALAEARLKPPSVLNRFWRDLGSGQGEGDRGCGRQERRTVTPVW